MKQLFIAVITLMFSMSAGAQEQKKDYATIDPSKKIQSAEVSCGECQFKMKGKSCHLAVRLDGKDYWVDGADVDSFGDAHDKQTGFCNAIRKADVQGVIKDGRFLLSYLKFTDEKGKLK
jgi:hypothetical protein